MNLWLVRNLYSISLLATSWDLIAPLSIYNDAEWNIIFLSAISEFHISSWVDLINAKILALRKRSLEILDQTILWILYKFKKFFFEIIKNILVCSIGSIPSKLFFSIACLEFSIKAVLVKLTILFGPILIQAYLRRL